MKQISRSIAFGVAFAAVWLCAPPTNADPSFFGYTGLVRVPTADTVGAGLWNAGFYAKTHRVGSINQYMLNMGVMENLEVGLFRSKAGNPAITETMINLKYAMPQPEATDVRLAMGVIDATNEANTLVYGVASKTLVDRRRGGMGGDAIDADGAELAQAAAAAEGAAAGAEAAPNDPRTLKELRHFRDIVVDGHFGIIGGTNSNFFVGAEVKFGRYVSVLGEHFNNAKNVGLRVHLSDRLTGDFGIVHMMNNTQHRLGVSYNERF